MPNKFSIYTLLFAFFALVSCAPSSPLLNVDVEKILQGYSQDLRIIQYKQVFVNFKSLSASATPDDAIVISDGVKALITRKDGIEYVSIVSSSEYDVKVMDSLRMSPMIKNDHLGISVPQIYDDIYSKFKVTALTKIGVSDATKEIVLSGHGLGGAIAMMSALELKRFFKGKVNVIATGVPDFVDQSVLVNPNFVEIAPVFILREKDVAAYSVHNKKTIRLPYYSLSESGSDFSFVNTLEPRYRKPSSVDLRTVKDTSTIILSHEYTSYGALLEFAIWAQTLQQKTAPAQLTAIEPVIAPETKVAAPETVTTDIAPTDTGQASEVKLTDATATPIVVDVDSAPSAK